LQASASQNEPVLGLFHRFYPNGSRTLRGPRASFDIVNADFYTFQIIVSKFEVWKGAALSLAAPLCGTILTD